MDREIETYVKSDALSFRPFQAQQRYMQNYEGYYRSFHVSIVPLQQVLEAYHCHLYDLDFEIPRIMYSGVRYLADDVDFFPWFVEPIVELVLHIEFDKIQLK